MEEDKNKLSPETPVKNKVVQTYAEDMVRVLEDDKGGLIKKIIQGEEAHEREKRNLSPQSTKNKVYMLLSVLLLLVSSGTLYFLLQKKEAPSVPVVQQFTPIIFTDKNFILDITDLKKDDISKKVFDEVSQSKVKIGGVEATYLTLEKTPIGFEKFIEKISGNFSIEKKNIVNDRFMMGGVKSKEEDSIRNDFFILLKVTSIPDVFAPLRAWEKKMFFDLHGFFGIDFSPDTKYLLTKEFQNAIIENKNARILYDTDNKIVLMYVFVDDTSVVITDSENAVREIMFRLGSGQIKK